MHFAADELPPIFREWRRLIEPQGALLLGFHVGGEVVHRDDLWGQPVSLDFRFHRPVAVVRALESAGFAVTESCERAPYREVEHPSRRCYVFATPAGE